MGPPPTIITSKCTSLCFIDNPVRGLAALLPHVAGVTARSIGVPARVDGGNLTTDGRRHVALGKIEGCPLRWLGLDIPGRPRDLIGDPRFVRGMTVPG